MSNKLDDLVDQLAPEAKARLAELEKEGIAKRKEMMVRALNGHAIAHWFLEGVQAAQVTELEVAIALTHAMAHVLVEASVGVCAWEQAGIGIVDDDMRINSIVEDIKVEMAAIRSRAAKQENKKCH